VAIGEQEPIGFFRERGVGLGAVVDRLAGITERPQLAQDHIAVGRRVVGNQDQAALGQRLFQRIGPFGPGDDT
jgi:hypothetical protein